MRGLGAQIRLLRSGRIKEAVEYWDLNIAAYSAISIVQRTRARSHRRISHRRISNRGQRANIGKEKISLCDLEFLGCLVLKLKREYFRPRGKSLSNQIVYTAGRRSQRICISYKLKSLQVRETEHHGERCISSILVVLRVQQQKLRLRQVYAGETVVQFGFQFVLEKRFHLMSYRLAFIHRLLRDRQHRVRLQRVVESLAHGEKNLLFSGNRILVLGFGRIVCAGNQIGRAPEVGD